MVSSRLSGFHGEIETGLSRTARILVYSCTSNGYPVSVISIGIYRCNYRCLGKGASAGIVIASCPTSSRIDAPQRVLSRVNKFSPFLDVVVSLSIPHPCLHIFSPAIIHFILEHNTNQRLGQLLHLPRSVNCSFGQFTHQDLGEYVGDEQSVT